MFLSDTHERVLYYCYRHKYVSIESLKLLFPPAMQREQVRKQLAKMVRANLLKRFKIFRGTRIVDMLYTVDLKGLLILSDTVNVSKIDYEFIDALKQSYKHRSVLADIDIRLRNNPTIQWYTESESVHQYGASYSEIIRPDGTLHKRNEDSTVQTTFIEYEHTSRPKELRKKVRQYDQYLLYDSHLHHPHIKIAEQFDLCIVVDTNVRKKNCENILEDIGEQQFTINVCTLTEFIDQLNLA